MSIKNTKRNAYILHNFLWRYFANLLGSESLTLEHSQRRFERHWNGVRIVTYRKRKKNKIFLLIKTFFSFVLELFYNGGISLFRSYGEKN